jgi:hypothetical protein
MTVDREVVRDLVSELKLLKAILEVKLSRRGGTLLTARRA